MASNERVCYNSAMPLEKTPEIEAYISEKNAEAGRASAKARRKRGELLPQMHELTKKRLEKKVKKLHEPTNTSDE